MSHIIKVMGIDPSMRNTGLALAEVNIQTEAWVVTHLQLVKTEAKDGGKAVRQSSRDLAAAQALHKGIASFIAFHQPTFAVSEIPSGTQSARGSFSNGLCCGLMGALSIPLVEVSPTEVKLAACGHKHAAKEEIIEWAVGKFPGAPWQTRRFKGEIKLLNENEHLADACAAIAACLKTAQFKQAVSMMRAAQQMAA